MSTPIPSIDSLTPEEIRVMCAEKLGWRQEVFGPLVQDYRWHKPDGQSTHGNPPAFTESADAALLLCAWMEEKRWVPQLTLSGQWTCVFNWESGKMIGQSADTLALAICKAFLIANGLAV